MYRHPVVGRRVVVRGVGVHRAIERLRALGGGGLKKDGKEQAPLEDSRREARGTCHRAVSEVSGRGG